MEADQVIQHKHKSGFTLIEVMIVVAIVAIVAMVALPSYLEQIRKSNRSDAMVALNDAAQRLQRCFTSQGAYNSGTCAVEIDLRNGITSTEGFYTLTAALAATTYTLTATPIAGTRQATDAGCTTFTLTQTGLKGATGTNAANCW